MSRQRAAVSALVSNDYELVSELGQANDGTEAFLARERTTGELVALRVGNLAVGKGAESITITRMLDSNVPADSRFCPNCHTRIRDWRRFCPLCNADLAGTAVPAAQAESLLQAALASSDRPLDVLGQMPRTEGGAAVYFGSEPTTGQIVAFNLQPSEKQNAAARFSINITSILSRTVVDQAARKSAADDSLTVVYQPQPDPRLPAAGSNPPVDPVEAEAAAIKVCPACAKEFEVNTRFCPDDGSVLRHKGGSESLVGEVIADRYHILAKIGQGGMGQVYLAEHVRIGRRCAVKVLNRSLTNDIEAVNRFSREAANAARINDENVADIYDFGESKEHGIYLAMEYVEGEPLSRILAREAPLLVSRALLIASQVARGLAAAHRRGIVHRDLTPNNIVIGQSPDEGEQVKIVDFGIAKALQDSNTRVTKTGFVVGTPQYMSPEQLIGDHVDGRSDIYQLGCILFEMLTGTRPFSNPDGTELFTRRLTEPPPRPSDRNPHLPAGVDDLVLRAMQQNRDGRYESALALRSALEDLLWELSDSDAPADPAAERKVTTRPRRSDTPVRTPAMPATPASAFPDSPRPIDRADLAVPSTPRPQAVTPEARATIVLPPPPPTPRTPSGAFEGLGDGVAAATQPTRPPRRARIGRPAVAVLGIVGLSALGIVIAINLSNPPEPSAPAPLVVPVPSIPETEPVASGPDEKASQAEEPRPAPQPAGNDATPARAERGSLVLSGELPGGAVVQVDGNRVTDQSRPVPLDPGTHVVVITANGFEPIRDSVKIDSGEALRFRFSLRPITVQTQPVPELKTQAAATATTFDPATAAQEIEKTLLGFVAALDGGQAGELRTLFPGATDAQITELLRLRGGRQVTLDPGYRPPAAINPAGTESMFILFFRDSRISVPAPFQARLVHENGTWRITRFARRQ